MKPDRVILAAAAVAGFTAVALGAFGAHALKATLEGAQLMETWKTAAHYHLAHAVALFIAACAGPCFRRCAAWCWIGGTVLFSGSLYLLAATGIRGFGAVTPFGGVLLAAGWLLLLLPPRRAA